MKKTGQQMTAHEKHNKPMQGETSPEDARRKAQLFAIWEKVRIQSTKKK